MKLQLKRSNVIESGAAKLPTAAQLEYGELAINYNQEDPAIFLKDSNNNVIRISGIGNIADDGQVELPASTTPPANPLSGNLWFNSDDGRLYIYYTDGDSSQWVDASPDSWDPSSYPDVSDDDAQSGTLDDRYLMLNTANDPLTGGLIVEDGNVGIGTTDPDYSLQVAKGDAATVSVKCLNDNTQPVAGRLVYTFDDGDGASINGTRVSGETASGVDLSFRTGGITNAKERMRIDSTGNVGIGTDSPASLLHISSTVDTALKVQAANAVSTIELLRGNNTGFGIDPTYDYRLKNEAGNLTIQNGVNSTISDLLTIDNLGKVGIGTSSPTDKLTIASGSNQIGLSTGNQSLDGTLDIGHFGNGAFIGTIAGTDATANVLRLGVSGTEKMRINSSGKVGIGTNNPSDKLEVNGNIRFTAAGQGINFNNYGSGAAIASNLLDDYEEGTWTPTIQDCTAYNTQKGSYVKIGKYVYWQCRVQPTAASPSSSSVTLSGLPFPSSTSSISSYGGAIATYGVLVSRIGFPNLNLHHGATSNFISFLSNISPIATNDANVNLIGNFLFSGWYLVD
ncbi:hypothetical protein N8654_01965 [Synechococcus sp. AH-601-B19]|nr:hypothetical protein [Synechococcus sp. AH-601-B19]